MVRFNNGAPGRNSLLQAPAVQALLIQVFSFLLVLALAHGLSRWLHVDLMLAVALVAQGGIAALISRWRRLARWWIAIQAVFPVALVAMLSLQLPPSIFLCGFIVLLGLYWSTFRTQVPFFPSGRDAWEVVASRLPSDRAVRFIDIGSGLGGLILHLVERRPDSTFTGIELAPLPWFASILRGRILRSKARFIRGDYERLDFASYDVVFAYLSPAAAHGLWQKARTEMRKGSLLLSYEFDIPGATPDWVSEPVDGNRVLYGWTM